MQGDLGVTSQAKSLAQFVPAFGLRLNGRAFGNRSMFEVG
ncbi:hypothetical protein RBSH_02221 [Rhodopirellula baltica SH28]|uniref:Uncharacterized protein n=1 Tax=Rhodopirellula baltica SH28 TaxID=993517 RepID=K5D756_RHOBT|nr:hypothetical protein RBSH_02221 [Rhodopirellula baltica SH28]